MRFALIAALLTLPVPARHAIASEMQSISVANIADDGAIPVTGKEWIAFGRALYDAGRYRESVAAFERGVQQHVDNAPSGAWNIARGYARLGNRKQTLRWLAHARELGFRDDRATRAEQAFERAIAKQPSALRWQDEVRCLELDAAARRSVERRRVDLMDYQEANEEVGFKGTMTLLGCGMLWGVILLVVLSRVYPWSGWLWLILPLLVGFMLLQFLRYVIRPTKDEEPQARGEELK